MEPSMPLATSQIEFKRFFTNVIKTHPCLKKLETIYLKMIDELAYKEQNILYVEKYGEFVPFVSMFSQATNSDVYGCSFNKNECFDDEFQKHYSKHFKYDKCLQKGFNESYSLLIFGDVEKKDEEEENFPSNFKDTFYIYNNLEPGCIILYKSNDNTAVQIPELEIIFQFQEYTLFKLK